MKTLNEQIYEAIKTLTKDNKVTTYQGLIKYFNYKLTYYKIRSNVKKLEDSKRISIIYPGLGMSRRAEQYIYAK